MLTRDECLEEAIRAEEISERAYGEARQRLLMRAQRWRLLAIESPPAMGPAHGPDELQWLQGHDTYPLAPRCRGKA
jgi:hypothetical protein